MENFSNSANLGDLEIPNFFLMTKHTVDRTQSNITAPLLSLLTFTAVFSQWQEDMCCYGINESI